MITPASSSPVTSRLAKSTPKRRTAPIEDDSATPELTAPLSELTKHMTHIPVRDMEAHAHRSLEVRLKEVEKKNGKIARPMNSFLLYRSAYAERTKEWCSKNNHQIVSRVSGASWPLETPEIREKYEQLAIIERENHKKAHPDYKFSPNKATSAALKRKRSPATADSDAESLAGDMTCAHTPSSTARMMGHRRLRTANYDMRPQAPLPPQYAREYTCMPYAGPWVTTSSSPIPRRYKQANDEARMQREMMRAAEPPPQLTQWHGHSFDFDLGLTPAEHRRTLEAPIYSSSSQPFASSSPMPTTAVNPQLLHLGSGLTWDGNQSHDLHDASAAVDPRLFMHTGAQLEQESPTDTAFSVSVPSPLENVCQLPDALKLDLSGYDFTLDPLAPYL
ncbi:hypothetical protein KEM52_005367 [Ascosphaera acerosa]|nr:hypothetical protein KEM52_005367 [Ascosphaera acerosa]